MAEGRGFEGAVWAVFLEEVFGIEDAVWAWRSTLG